MASTTDYDAPRMTVAADDSLEELQARRRMPDLAAIDVDDDRDDYLPAGGDLVDDEYAVTVIPMQTDEFRCTRCFLVGHRSQRAPNGLAQCRDCSS